MSKKLLTLNIGAANVELAEYEVGAKGALTLASYGVAALAAPLDGGDANAILTPALQEAARTAGIRPGKIAVAISGQMVFPRFAAIPAAGGAEKFEQMVRYEIEQNIPFPIDEIVCDRQVLGDTESGDKSVLIVAAKVDQVEAITSAVAAAGFTPELVDAAPLALTNALRHVAGDDGSCRVLLDIGSKTTSLVIVEGDKLYNRSIPVAGNAVTKEIAAALGCSAEEAEELKLSKGYVSMGGVTEDEDEVVDRISKACRAVMTRLNAEISRSINFYRASRAAAPTCLYLTGGSALLPQIDAFFQESLQIEVAFFDPFASVPAGPKVDAAALETDGIRISATVGLALHLADAARFAVNLLPPSLVEARAEKAKIPFVIAGGAALVAALVLVMLAIGRQAEVVAAERDAVQAEVSALQSADGQVKAAEEKLAAATAEAEALCKLLVARAAAAQRLNAVRDSLLPGMWVEKWDDGRLTVRYWSDRVKASGGKTPGELVVDKLKGRPAVDADSVKISDMSAIGKASQVEQFTVELKFK